MTAYISNINYNIKLVLSFLALAERVINSRVTLA